MDVSFATSYPRPLSHREREVLDFLLSVRDPRAEALREQAGTAQVVGQCACGCATIDLEVDRTTAAPSLWLSSLAIEATNGLNPPYELLLFLESGWLSSIEIVYYDGIPPPVFPPPATFERPWISAEIARDLH
jgi:hypothetical protein